MKKTILITVLLFSIAIFGQRQTLQGIKTIGETYREVGVPLRNTDEKLQSWDSAGKLGYVLKSSISGSASASNLQQVLDVGQIANKYISIRYGVNTSVLNYNFISFNAKTGNIFNPEISLNIYEGLIIKSNGNQFTGKLQNNNAKSNCIFNLPLAPAGGTYDLVTNLELDLKANLLSPNFTGNVKIGSNAFPSNLHILSSGGVNNGLKIEAVNPSSYATIDFANQSNIISGQFLNTNSSFNSGIFMPNSTYLANYGDSLGLVSSGYIKFVTNGFSNVDEKMRILQNGNIGIGTATPGTKLAVVGLPIFENNANAITGGLSVGDFYRTPIGVLMVRF